MAPLRPRDRTLSTRTLRILTCASDALVTMVLTCQRSHRLWARVRAFDSFCHSRHTGMSSLLISSDPGSLRRQRRAAFCGPDYDCDSCRWKEEGIAGLYMYRFRTGRERQRIEQDGDACQGRFRRRGTIEKPWGRRARAGRWEDRKGR